MEDVFSKPVASEAPVSKGTPPWQFRVEYRSGKVPANYAEMATPELSKAGFSYYDKDLKSRVVLDKFSAGIVAVTFGVSGTVPDGSGGYTNYWSNLVFDTREQPLVVYEQGSPARRIATGLYRDIKDELPTGVNFAKVLIVYLFKQDMLVSMNLSAQFESALRKAIGESAGTKPGEVDLFRLCSSKEHFWGVLFSGKFQKFTREGAPYAGAGDLFFAPVIDRAGLIRKSERPEEFETLSQFSVSVKSYIDGFQVTSGPSVISTNALPQTPSATIVPPTVAGAVQMLPQDPFQGVVEPAPETGEELPF